MAPSWLCKTHCFDWQVFHRWYSFQYKVSSSLAVWHLCNPTSSLSFGWWSWDKHLASFLDQVRWWYGRSSNFPISVIGMKSCLELPLSHGFNSTYLFLTVERHRFCPLTRIWSPEPLFFRIFQRKCLLVSLHFRIQMVCPSRQDPPSLPGTTQPWFGPSPKENSSHFVHSRHHQVSSWVSCQ